MKKLLPFFIIGIVAIGGYLFLPINRPVQSDEIEKLNNEIARLNLQVFWDSIADLETFEFVDSVKLANDCLKQKNNALKQETYIYSIQYEKLRKASQMSGNDTVQPAMIFAVCDSMINNRDARISNLEAINIGNEFSISKLSNRVLEKDTLINTMQLLYIELGDKYSSAIYENIRLGDKVVQIRRQRNYTMIGVAIIVITYIIIKNNETSK